MQIVLEVVDGPHEGRTFSLEGHDNFLVGRARCAHFRLPEKDRRISRIHFMIEVNPPCCRLFDMGSRNGTRVNGRRVKAVDLLDGDQIGCGGTTIRVSVDNSMAAPADAARRAARRPPKAEPAGDVGEYRIVRQLERPGIGESFLAIRRSDGWQVALKVIRQSVEISDQEIAQLLDEARQISALRHQNLISLYEADRDSDLLYFAMQYAPGNDAGALLEREGPLAIGRAVCWACDVLDALQYAHDSGLVHRDVKPVNWIVSGKQPRETCRLGEFGLVRIYESSPLSGLTMLGDPAGTLPYIPPEQITQYRGPHPAADQYSAAATLYRLLTGSFVLDFERVPAEQRLIKVIFDPPVPIQSRRAEVPDGLAAAIHTALRKEPEERHRNVAEFRKALMPYRGEC